MDSRGDGGGVETWWGQLLRHVAGHDCRTSVGRQVPCCLCPPAALESITYKVGNTPYNRGAVFTFQDWFLG